MSFFEKSLFFSSLPCYTNQKYEKRTEPMKKNSFKKKIPINLTRILAGTLVLSLCGVLILWEVGIIDLPFLVRKDRRDPEENAETGESTEKEVMTVDWDNFAKAAIDSVYSASVLENLSEIVTPLPFDPDNMTLTKQKLSDGKYSTALGFVIKEDGENKTLFRADEMMEIQGAENFEITFYRTAAGEGIFIDKKTNKYYKFDVAGNTFQEISFDPVTDAPGIYSLMPRSYCAADETPELFSENGLFGYRGEYKEGRKTKTFTVPATYPIAFPYSEGFAVMADETGKITIRNNKGEEVFGSLSLLLPGKEGEKSPGFYAFDGGFLRVIIAEFDEKGNLKDKRESLINTKGQEVKLPDGYRIMSLSEGILVVTDGKKIGYLSASGAWLTSPDLKKGSPFMEGIAVLTDKNGKMGLIDYKGNFILPCTFDYISDFSDGYALCFSESTGWYLLSKVNGSFNTDKNILPNVSSFHTKVTITRGPQNTFDYDPDEIIEFPPILSTPSRTTHPENEIETEE